MTSISAVAEGREKFSAPRVGGLAAVISAAQFMADPIGTTQKLHQRYGPVAELRFPFGADRGRGAMTFMFGIGARYNERVLSDTATFRTSGLMTRGPANSAQRRIRDGIIGMNGPQHVHYRKMLLPPLRRPVVDAMISRMSEIASRNVASWPRGEALDLWPRVRHLTQDIAISLLFTAEGGDHAEAHCAADLINEHVRLNGLPMVAACPVDMPGLPYHTMMRSAERVEAYLGPWAMKRKGDTRRDDLMSILVNSNDHTGRPTSESLINSHTLTLFGAAYETCQTALVWTLYLLAQHPEAAGKLLDEIGALTEDPTRLADQLHDCTWLDAVVRESLRILPPVPIQMRVATRDTDFVGHDIRDKTRIVISPYATNRLPEFYPDGDRFLPERWESIDPDQFEYIVFSAGPRTCPGAWFGTTLVKVALVHILRELRVEVVPDARIDRHVSITMSPKRGMPVTLHAQDRRFGRSRVTGHLARMITL